MLQFKFFLNAMLDLWYYIEKNSFIYAFKNIHTLLFYLNEKIF